MNGDDFTPGSPAWLRVVSASKVAAILGLSKWESPWSIWHQMKGNVPPPDVTDDMRRGHYLEAAVIDWWNTQHPGAEEGDRQVVFMREAWAIATPDAIGIDEHGRTYVLDAKTEADDDDWWAFDDATGAVVPVVPAYYLVQVMWQLAMFPEAKVAYVAVLFGRPFELREYVVERDERMIDALLRRCRAFYDSLAADEPPPLDAHTATYLSARRMHPDIEDRDVTVPIEDGRRFAMARAGMELAEAEWNYARSMILTAMGNARRAVTADGRVIARRQRHKTGVALHGVAKGDR